MAGILTYGLCPLAALIMTLAWYSQRRTGIVPAIGAILGLLIISAWMAFHLPLSVFFAGYVAMLGTVAIQFIVTLQRGVRKPAGRWF